MKIVQNCRRDKEPKEPTARDVKVGKVFALKRTPEHVYIRVIMPNRYITTRFDVTGRVWVLCRNGTMSYIVSPDSAVIIYHDATLVLEPEVTS